MKNNKQNIPDQTRAWCFTLNNYTNRHIEQRELRVENKERLYLGYAKEVGSNGTPHLQGARYTPKKITLTGLKTIIGPGLKAIHREIIKGTWEQAITYFAGGHPSKPTSPEPDDLIEFGKRPTGGNRFGRIPNPEPNKPIPYKLVVDRIERDQFDLRKELSPQAWLRYFTTNIKYQMTKKPTHHTHHLCGLWLTGVTGTGKSLLGRQLPNIRNAPTLEVYTKMIDNQWWDLYFNHKIIVIDDLGHRDSKAHQAWFTRLKTLTDHYPVRVEKKGGVLFIRPWIIVVTSNRTIMEWINQINFTNFTELDKDALKRRFTEVVRPLPGYEGIELFKLNHNELKHILESHQEGKAWLKKASDRVQTEMAIKELADNALLVKRGEKSPLKLPQE